ncbi:MAG: hypothetical protein JKX92_13500 [Porticoccaceae bacterium]|nr:hypothetical protein [Porticoccaceae bacterium]
MMVPLASLLFVAAIAIWSRRIGLEFAVCYALLTLALTAWLVIAFKRELRPAKPLPAGLPERDAKTSLTHKLATFAVAGPLTLVTGCLTSIALASLLPIARNQQLVVSALACPFFIALIVYWLCSSEKLACNTLLLCSAIMASSLYIFL